MFDDPIGSERACLKRKAKADNKAEYIRLLNTVVGDHRACALYFTPTGPYLAPLWRFYGYHIACGPDTHKQPSLKIIASYLSKHKIPIAPTRDTPYANVVVTGIRAVTDFDDMEPNYDSGLDSALTAIASAEQSIIEADHYAELLKAPKAQRILAIPDKENEARKTAADLLTTAAAARQRISNAKILVEFDQLLTELGITLPNGITDFNTSAIKPHTP
ncbi:hypothetical protein N7451_000309 [Penicillium sp. IBT 35674x]|nr:hypothetical protein N7451_000309 [Penicillium sp. IBT 35674x]